jgi:hypothetical protein
LVTHFLKNLLRCRSTSQIEWKNEVLPDSPNGFHHLTLGFLIMACSPAPTRSTSLPARRLCQCSSWNCRFATALGFGFGTGFGTCYHRTRLSITAQGAR